MGTKIQTGFLMSSSSRLQGHKGLGWAPSCPSVQSSPSKESGRGIIYLAYDGNNTQTGVITSEGLQAKWLVHKFLLSSTDGDIRFPRNIETARGWLKDYRWGALLRPGQLPGPRYIPASYQGTAREPLLAACGFNDGRCWE